MARLSQLPAQVSYGVPSSSKPHGHVCAQNLPDDGFDEREHNGTEASVSKGTRAAAVSHIWLIRTASFDRDEPAHHILTMFRFAQKRA